VIRGAARLKTREFRFQSKTKDQEMANESLVRPLFDGPLDIVADVHGEIDALRLLLKNLDYSDTGAHPQGRRLVFLGDLTDRGPDSPAVVRLVDGLIAEGLAQCILGNHELNLLNGEKKHGSGWFYGQSEENLDGSGRGVPQTPADPPTREQTLRLFRRFPLALVRNDLRIVHACWNGQSVERARCETDVVPFFAREETRIKDELRQFERDQDALRLLTVFGIRQEDALGTMLLGSPGEEADPRELLRQALNDPIGKKLARQNWNPVKVLTSGPERRRAQPFFAGGKTRHEGRLPWWDRYTDAAWCVFGHYWRLRLPNDTDGDYLFDEARLHAPLGPGRAMCIDYSVGKRWRERPPFGPGEPFRTCLAALRWPEKELMLAGRRVPLHGL